MAENEQLRERIRALEDLLMQVQPLPLEWGLSPGEARVFGAVVNRDMASREHIHHALYGLDPSGGAEIKIVDVFVCKLRKKLKPFGIPINTHSGQGYSLPDAVRQRFRLPSSPLSRSPSASAA